jgi:signal transduction histidine kinase
MQDDLIPQSRAERLIALGRAVIAAAAFGAIYIDPLEPAMHPQAIYALLTYTVYALVFAVWTIVAPVGSSHAVRVGTHVVDLAFFGAINYLTAGASSPFFVFFVFSIVCAMLRFGRRGTLNAAVAAFVIFMVSVTARMDVAGFELNRFIIRCVYLLVIASLLVYVADYQQRIQSDLARIVRWRRIPSQRYEQLVEELMREPALIFGAKRVMLVYEHLASRVGFVGTMNGDDLACEPVPRELVEPMFDRAPTTYVRSGSFAAITEERGPAPPPPRGLPALPPELVAAYDINDVVATPFTGEFVQGRLLLLDGRQPLLEEVNLARIVATVIASRLDHHHAAEQLRRGAVAEERVRVARDLHDSVLQALTGVALQLRTLPRLMLRDAALADQRLGEIEQTITAAQKDLRWFIEQLHTDHRREDEEAAVIAERLLSMSQRFEKQWGLTVDADVAPIIHLLPVPMRHEVYTIVSEAVANAAKHASAKSVRVKARVHEGDVCIDVADDGKGFPFRGRYTVPEMARRNVGPRTLRDRVTSLGGSMIVDSSDRGSEIEIRLPMRANGA